MADTDEAYVPVSTVLTEDVSPTDYFGSIDFSFLDAVAYVGGSIADDESGLAATLDLQIMASPVGRSRSYDGAAIPAR